MLEVQVKRQIDNANNATDTGYLTVTHGHKVPISTSVSVQPLILYIVLDFVPNIAYFVPFKYRK